MTDEATQHFEASNPVLGSLKVSSANMNTLFTIFSFVLMVLMAWTLWAHDREAKADGGAVANVLKQSNESIAAALRESNQNTMKAIDKLTDAQERTARAQDKTNCLLAIPPDSRARAEELCERILSRRR